MPALVASARERIDRTLDGTVNVTGRGDPARTARAFAVVASLSFRYEREVAGGSIVAMIRMRLDADFSRDAGVRGGSMPPAGDFTFRSKSDVDYLEKGTTRPTAESYSTWRTSDPVLHWNQACRFEQPRLPAFDDGAAIQGDSRGKTVRIEFSDCGVWETSDASGHR